MYIDLHLYVYLVEKSCNIFLFQRTDQRSTCKVGQFSGQ